MAFQGILVIVVPVPVLFLFFLYIIFWGVKAFIGQDSRELTGKHWAERGEQDQQRTSRRESNSGCYEHSCAIYRSTNHKAFGAAPVPIPNPAVPRKTNPLIQCITENKAEGLHNEQICSNLLEESADPNKPSTNGRTPELIIVEKLEEYGLQKFTPLQYAVDHGREDIVKFLEAGATVNPANDKNMQNINQKIPQNVIDLLKNLIGSSAAPSKKKKKKKKKKKILQELGSQEVEFQDKWFPDTVGTSIEESVQPSDETSRRWHQISRRWRSKLEKLANIDNYTYKLRNLTLVISDEFLIAKGSGGTEVYLGLKDDGTEVAVKRMLKSNYRVLRNEEEFLRLPELDSTSIVRYVDFAEDIDFGYLVLQLCEYTLEEYIQDHLPDDSAKRSSVLKKLVNDVLCSLQVLHDEKTKVLHRDIKPQNVLIDIKGKARLADFGISRRLKEIETTLQATIAGTKCWKAIENINDKVKSRYKRSSDIQVAGMLVYYILSGRHHPFGEHPFCEVNILEGRYSLEHLDDDVAKDLVEWMINGNPKERPTVEQTLAHPFLWTDERRMEYMRKVGNQNEVQKYRNVDEKLLQAIEKCTEGKSFSEWKTKLPSKIVQKLDGKKKAYSENTLGLLRFIRNLDEHYIDEPDMEIDLTNLFPDLFGSVFRFAKERGWNSRPSLKKLFSSAPQI